MNDRGILSRRSHLFLLNQRVCFAQSFGISAHGSNRLQHPGPLTLDDLAVRFTELAEERGAEERMAALGAVRPTLLPSLRSLAVAAEIVRKEPSSRRRCCIRSSGVQSRGL